MTKLIDLFNEYNRSPEIAEGEPVEERTETEFLLMSKENRAYMLSKDYGFIKWLVENDKIDHKIYEDMKFTAIKQGVLVDKKSGSTAQETREIIKNGCIDTFIALLAISDTPIQDLCVWLK